MEDHNEILDSDLINKYSYIEEQRIISVNKFIFLCIITAGLYQIWWTYKAWRFFQQKDGYSIMPAARAIFSIFFLITLFEMILKFAREKGYKHSYSSMALYGIFLFGLLSSRLPDPIWLVTFLSVLAYIPPFKAFNFARLASTDLNLVEQHGFNGRQIALIVFGGILWFMLLYGMYLQSTGQFDY